MIDFAFKNSPPLSLQISTPTQYIKTYQFYVRHPGPLKAAIDSVYGFRLTESGAFSVQYDLIAGVGTIPESPGSEAQLTAALTDDGTGRKIGGNIWLW